MRDGETAKRLLAEQLVDPVRWVGCVRQCAELAGSDTMFVELGPGRVLAGLIKRIVPGAKVVSLGTAEDVAAFMAATA